MIIKDGSPKDLSERLKQTGKSLICYGAGIMPYYLSDIFLDFGISDKIKCFVDGDTAKQGGIIKLNGKSYDIKPPELLKQSGDHIVLITCETFKPIVDILDGMGLGDGVECYVYPLMNFRYFCETKSAMPQVTAEQKIPKKIHYTWFSGDPMPALFQACIKSWGEFCPEYEIIQWNKTNYDVLKCDYTRRCNELKKYEALSDYARWDILYNEGGIYLDADVELIKSLDAFLCNGAFVSRTEWAALNSGSGCGAAKGLGILLEMRDEPRGFSVPLDASERYIQDYSGNLFIGNAVSETQVLKRCGFKQNLVCQTVNNMLVLPPDVFATESLLDKDLYITEKTVGIHHCNGFWKTADALNDRQKTRGSYGWLLDRIERCF